MKVVQRNAYRKNRSQSLKPTRPAKGRIRVAIVDDHPLCRKGLRLAILEDTRFEVVGEADHSEAALKLILQHKPDVAVMDVNLSGISGLEVAGILKAKQSKTHLVVLTVLNDEKVFNRALNLGIRGYVLKKNAAAEILSCIAAVARGEAYVSASLTDYLLRRSSRVESLTTHQPGLESLTAAERRILKRIAQGKTSREIAAELFVSHRTVESHRVNISAKLQLKGPNNLLHFAVEHRDALNHLS
jgi:DNA-binding NarL/FixJ family response regulator